MQSMIAKLYWVLVKAKLVYVLCAAAAENSMFVCNDILEVNAVFHSKQH